MVQLPDLSRLATALLDSISSAVSKDLLGALARGITTEPMHLGSLYIPSGSASLSVSNVTVGRITLPANVTLPANLSLGISPSTHSSAAFLSAWRLSHLGAASISELSIQNITLGNVTRSGVNVTNVTLDSVVQYLHSHVFRPAINASRGLISSNGTFCGAAAAITANTCSTVNNASLAFCRGYNASKKAWAAKNLSTQDISWGVNQVAQAITGVPPPGNLSETDLQVGLMEL
jgi:hypothetical protein